MSYVSDFDFGFNLGSSNYASFQECSFTNSFQISVDLDYLWVRILDFCFFSCLQGRYHLSNHTFKEWRFLVDQTFQPVHHLRTGTISLIIIIILVMAATLVFSTRWKILYLYWIRFRQCLQQARASFKLIIASWVAEPFKYLHQELRPGFSCQVTCSCPERFLNFWIYLESFC